MKSATTTCLLCAIALTAPLLNAQPHGSVCVASLPGFYATPTMAPGLYLRIRKPPAPAPRRLPTDSTSSGWATWYSRESCRREGTGGDRVLMANGKPLNDHALTCAMWLTNSAGRPRYPDGRTVTVRNVGDGTTVCVAWTDNGPGSVPRSRGVIVDLSRAAMLALAGPEGLRVGKIRVEVDQ